MKNLAVAQSGCYLRPGIFPSILTGSVLVTLLPISPFAKAQSINILTVPGADYVQAHAISADGKFAAGTGHLPNGTNQLFRQDKAGNQILTDLPNSSIPVVTGITRDGSRIVGFFYVLNSNQLYRSFSWVPAEGGGVLTYLPTPPSPYDSVLAMGISADGTRIACTLSSYQASKATMGIHPGASSDYRILETVTSAKAYAEGISPDGRIVMGNRSSTGALPFVPYAYEFTGPAASDPVQPIPFGTRNGTLTVASDNNILAGDYSFAGSNEELVRWDPLATGITPLSLGGAEGAAGGISSNGKRIVGRANGTAFLWQEGVGTKALKIILAQDYGLNMSAWTTLTVAESISSDGTQIVGSGTLGGFWVDLHRSFSATIKPAVKITFPTVLGKKYQLQTTGNMQSWSDEGPEITGTGSIEAAYSDRDLSQEFFRVQEF